MAAVAPCLNTPLEGNCVHHNEKFTVLLLDQWFTFIVARYFMPSAIIQAKDNRSFSVSLEFGLFSPVLYVSSCPLLLRRYPSKSPYGKYSKTINIGSGIILQCKIKRTNAWKLTVSH